LGDAKRFEAIESPTTVYTPKLVPCLLESLESGNVEPIYMLYMLITSLSFVVVRLEQKQDAEVKELPARPKNRQKARTQKTG
jgi:hypothetical protein